MGGSAILPLKLRLSPRKVRTGVATACVIGASGAFKLVDAMTGAGGYPSPVMVAAQAAIVDRTAAEVATALSARRVRTILLKGPVLERWLYEGATRSYMDVDLLVSPVDRGRGEAVLRSLGYAPGLGANEIPPFDRELHARTWTTSGRPAIDLHHTLPGAAAPSKAVWTIVSRDTELMRVDRAEVEVPRVEVRTLHVVLHAAYHGAPEPKPLEDLSRALVRVDRDGWAAAARLAAETRATEAFAAGLRLLPAGRELADDLGLPPTSSLEVALRADPPAPLTLHLEWLRRAQGPRAKVALLVRLVFPPRSFMEPPPGTRRPRAALGWAYVVRLGKLRHVPAALRAWRRARRQGAG
jgi:hypothetical protein